ncbi:hypothetical protein VOLCADRAFT_103075 [Volvox carteri f. nagariensis]|uniref:Glycosyl hydrolases family 2 sugar binding domain-containing protein n=1 Tax=Volvox carteri f. nagariensis TaxID=3068 RepID=D8TJR3_VOLCA|nr:uncharacterized protein VOLCADRAFT_103075 [Volvox carteri f. nagariensis]EFJ52418.1 hypothetical protein VOLCADRAFT_103075 [Volvox carteri f. nagariensis]|eukprot:XP_002946491.1 hypothetical protein VOLCADRAFT_103075 [Volvox carteri f. nagariensis]
MRRFAWASTALLLVLVTSTPPSSTALNAVELWPAAQSFYGTDNIGVGKPFTDLSAKWIWYHTTSLAYGSGLSVAALFTTTVTVSTAGGMQALLNIIADDVADVYVNGAPNFSATHGWSAGSYTDRPLTVDLVQGTNVLAINVRNVRGPGALLASLSTMDGRTVLARTDKSWEVHLQVL